MSDGYGDVDRMLKAEERAALPSIADMDGAGAKLDAVTAALRSAAARQAGLLVATLLLGAASGCVSSAARDLAVAHEAHLIAFDGASQPHASYLVDDTEPGADGKTLTAKEKIKLWKEARAEVFASARALAEALK